MKIAALVLGLVGLSYAFSRRGPREKVEDLGIAHMFFVHWNRFWALHKNFVEECFVMADRMEEGYEKLRKNGVIFWIFCLVLGYLVIRIVLFLVKKNNSSKTHEKDSKFLEEIGRLYEIPLKQTKNEENPENTIGLLYGRLHTELETLKDSLLSLQVEIFSSHSSIWNSFSH